MSEPANTHDTWPRVVTLSYPVEWGSEHVTSLSFRRGRAGDLMGIKLARDGVDADSLMLVASRMSGRPLELIQKLDVDDAREVMAIALGFYGRCLNGGDTPS